MSCSSEGFAIRWIVPVVLFAGTLAGCATPDLYFDRRETISFHAGDAVASNIIAHAVDPWPRVAGNRNIQADGERMQAAAERYRTGKVIPPKGLTTSSVEFAVSPEAMGGTASPSN